MMLKLYAIALPVFILFDFVWLAFIAKDFYAKHIGFLMKSNVGWGAAILFYLLFILGLVVFVINPSIDKSSFLSAVLFGALYGLICYATYDLTNQATVKGWPLIVTIVDLLWGSFVSLAVSAITYLIATK